MNRDQRRPGILTIGVLIGSVVIGSGLLLNLYLVIEWSRPSSPPAGLVTAALTIVPVPSTTATEIPPTGVPASNPDDIPAPPDGEFSINSFVKISGTGGAGLRLRTNPGLDNEPVYLGMEDEIFKIETGPQYSDGYTWWFLVAPFDPDRNGWAVSNYLEPVQNP